MRSVGSKLTSNRRTRVRESRRSDDVRFPVSAFLPDGAACPRCGGKELSKVRDILDVWFDSGVSHLAVLRSGDYGLEDPYNSVPPVPVFFTISINCLFSPSLSALSSPPTVTSQTLGEVLFQNPYALVPLPRALRQNLPKLGPCQPCLSALSATSAPRLSSQSASPTPFTLIPSPP